jgi:hypothetical protein
MNSRRFIAGLESVACPYPEPDQSVLDKEENPLDSCFYFTSEIYRLKNEETKFQNMESKLTFFSLYLKGLQMS